MQEAVGIGPLAIDVDADDDQAAIRVLGLHLVEPGKGMPAGLAPRRPEVDQHDLAAKAREVERVAVIGGDGGQGEAGKSERNSSRRKATMRI